MSTPMESKKLLIKLLDVIATGPVSPSDVVTKTGLPRYIVLASFHILEALGIVKLIYGRGTYKVYVLSEVGMQVLNNLKKDNDEPVFLTEYISEDAQEAATA